MMITYQLKFGGRFIQDQSKVLGTLRPLFPQEYAALRVVVNIQYLRLV